MAAARSAASPLASAIGNPGVTERRYSADPSDFYPTPSWCVRRILERVGLPGGDWLEPSAGHGHIIRAVQRPDVRWHACEEYVECEPKLSTVVTPDRLYLGDFLDEKFVAKHLPQHFDVILGNPPFSKVFEFVKAAVVRADVTVLLLPLAFVASEGRLRFLQESPPDVYIIPHRISFSGDGGGDMKDCAWMVWRKATLNRAAGIIEWLPSTSCEERKRDRVACSTARAEAGVTTARRTRGVR